MNPTALVGHTLGDKYTLTALLGVGGFGAVYRAIQHPLGRTVAVKVLLDADADQRARFEREARILAALRHPRCAMMHDFGEHGGLFYLVVEFIDGVPLDVWMAAGHRISLEESVRWVDGILDALSEAHRQGIVHRDIKPGNVMRVVVDGRDDVRVLDFGIARGWDENSALTATGKALGTPCYMAPEQAMGRALGPATDVYAVGVLLFRLLAGREPFEGATAFEVMRAHVEVPPPPLPSHVMPALAAVVQQALAKHPADRFADAEAMRRALWAACDEMNAAGDEVMTESREARSRGRRWPMWVVVMLIIGAATGTVGVTQGGFMAPSTGIGGGVGILIGLSEKGPATVNDGGAAASERDAAGFAADRDRASDSASREGHGERSDGALKVARSDGGSGSMRTADAGLSGEGRARRLTSRGELRASRSALAAVFDSALAKCDCAAAERVLAALDAREVPRWAERQRRYEKTCRVLLPGGCARGG